MKKGFVNQELKNNISEITFGTPKSNSLPGEILELLAETILESGENKNVKAVLLKSEGEKAFCAGASFDELLEIEELEKSKITSPKSRSEPKKAIHYPEKSWKNWLRLFLMKAQNLR